MRKQKIAKHGIALYGNVAIERGYCKKCKSTAFIKEGKFVCCDNPATIAIPDKYHRVSEPPLGRKRPPKAEQERILTEQEYSCFYCGVAFGSHHRRSGKPITIKIEWDHRLPYILTRNNETGNFVAACHVCNGLKSDKVFQDVEEAQIYLAHKRKDKGYDF